MKPTGPGQASPRIRLRRSVGGRPPGVASDSELGGFNPLERVAARGVGEIALADVVGQQRAGAPQPAGEQRDTLAHLRVAQVAQLGERRPRPPPAAGRAAPPAPRRAGSLPSSVRSAPQRAGERARVGVVEHQQVDQRQQVVVALVARAEGDGAVEQRRAAARWRRTRSPRAPTARPAPPATRAMPDRRSISRPTRQQPPAVVARHAVDLRAGDRRELLRQALQRRQRLRAAGHRRAEDVGREVGVEVVGHAPQQAPLLGDRRSRSALALRASAARLKPTPWSRWQQRAPAALRVEHRQRRSAAGVPSGTRP